jgi:hypothetical protein
MHVHHLQEEGIVVVSGRVGFQVPGQEPQYATAGETKLFGPGVAHKWWNAGDVELHMTGWVKPPLNIEYFLSEIFAATERNGGARPGLFDIAFLATRYRTEFTMIEIPMAIQRVSFPSWSRSDSCSELFDSATRRQRCAADGRNGWAPCSRGARGAVESADPGAVRVDPPVMCARCSSGTRRSIRSVFGNTYYVGTAGLSSVLITSDSGHILLDGGLPQSAEEIDRHIRRLGFRTEDVRLIVNSHTHFDHAGGIHALQHASRAVVAASPSGARALRQGLPTSDDPQITDIMGTFRPCRKSA